MADRLVPQTYATMLAAYNAASNGDSILLQAGSTHASESLGVFKSLTIKSQDPLVKAIIDAVTGTRPFAFKSGSNGSRLENIALNAGTSWCLSADSTGTATITTENVDFIGSDSDVPLNLAGPGLTLDVSGGSIDAKNKAVAAPFSGVSIFLEGVEIAAGVAQYSLNHQASNGATTCSVIDCDITSGATSAAIIVAQNASTTTGRVTRIKNNRISATYKDGHVVQVGEEVSTASDGYLNDYEIDDNVITGTKGAAGTDNGINHGLFVGHNVNGKVRRNKTVGVGYGIVWKATGLDNTNGHYSFNIILNANIAARVKGVDGAILANNVCIIAGADSNSCLNVTDNDGLGSANGVVNVGNVYMSVTTGKPVASKSGTCSFARSESNCYICNALADFGIGGAPKTWAEWVAAVGETGSFCIVKNGTAWDVYTSEAPTVVAWSLSACPIDAATGRIVNMVGNPLLKRGAVVTGVNNGGELDIWGNAAPATFSNIGADQFNYAPGFGPWSTCDGILPLSAQPCKSHALPIGTGKITIFEGVASQAQIEEAK